MKQAERAWLEHIQRKLIGFVFNFWHKYNILVSYDWIPVVAEAV